MCGACWAFASTGVLEYMMKTRKNVSIPLSEQELIDCNSDEMTCNDGGWPTYAYDYIINNGLASTENYEYLAYNSECLNDRINRTVRINDTCEREFSFLLRI